MKTRRSILGSAVATANASKYGSALALATALVLPGVASAEVEFDPYILVDASIGYADKELTPGQQNDFDYYDSNVSSSVYGVRAAYDLGNGLTVKGWLEGDLNTSTGDRNPEGIFRREANVGIAGSFGEVSVGTRVNPLVIMHGKSFAMAGNSSSTMSSVALGFADFFTQKSVTYIAPKLGGFTAQVQYGFEDTDSSGALSPRDSMVSGYANYDFGPFWIGAAAQHVDGHSIQTETTSSSETGILAAGTTIAGFTLKASYMTNDEEDAAGVTTLDVDAWHVGTSYAFSRQFKAGVDYVQDDESSSLTHVRAQYSLSKNLTFYTMVNWTDNDADGRTFHQLWGNGTNLAFGAADDSEVAVATGAIVSF